jgi:hypothetical protein
VSNFLRRLRGAIGNTLMWVIGWTVLGFVTMLAYRMTGVAGAPGTIFDAALIGLKIGLGGGIAGTAFSLFIALAYRNRRIQEISALKFGVGGALVTAAAITAFVQGASILGGGGLVEWEYMVPTVPMFAVFGFVAAAASMKLAQIATRTSGDDEAGQGGQLGSGADAMPLRQRSRAEASQA